MKELLDTLLGKTRAYKAWTTVAQPGELQYHIHSEWRHSDDFWRQTVELFEAFDFLPDDFAGKTILDLGAGSQLRTKYFQNATLIALEPLGEQFLREVDNCDLQKAARLISAPAEERQADLENRIDLCVSINVLDHCYDFDAICGNIYSYLKPGGRAFLSFDYHKESDPMHPLTLGVDACLDLFRRLGFSLLYFQRGYPRKFAEKRGVSTYGHGPFCLNFFLEKPLPPQGEKRA